MATTDRTHPATTPAAGAKSQTIDRATLILTCFSLAEPCLTLAELARRLNLNESTVYRYVATLQAAGLLERDGQRRGYRLGLRVVELAFVALNQMEVRKDALPEMDRLRDELECLVNLAVLDQGDVIHIAHSVPPGWPVWATTPGRRAVAHCTALGKVLLAHRPWDEVRQTIERFGWRPYTDRSIQDFARLKAELARIREHGHSVDEGERTVGVVCFAVPIRDRTGQVVAALSVSNRSERLNAALRAEIVRRLAEAASRVSFRLGYADTYAFL